jgi:two-component system response regulator DevR
MWMKTKVLLPGSGVGDVKLLIVEDQPIMRLGLVTFLKGKPGLDVLTDVSSREEAFEVLQDSPADLVLLPLRLHGRLLGPSVCRDLKAIPYPPRVLMYTAFSSPSESSLAFLAGADSLLSKTESEESLLQAIYATARAESVWQPEARTRAEAERLRDQMIEAGLTAREREVAGLVLQRRSNAEIARELFIEISTVKSHVSKVLQKLQMRNRDDLLA